MDAGVEPMMTKLWKRLVHWLLWKRVGTGNTYTKTDKDAGRRIVAEGEWTASPSTYKYAWYRERWLWWRRWS